MQLTDGSAYEASVSQLLVVHWGRLHDWKVRTDGLRMLKLYNREKPTFVRCLMRNFDERMIDSFLSKGTTNQKEL